MATPTIGNFATSRVSSSSPSLAHNNDQGCVVAVIHTYASDTITARATINGVEMHSVANTQKVTDTYQKMCWFILPNAPSGAQTIQFYVSASDFYTMAAWSLGEVDWWNATGDGTWYATGSSTQASIAVTTQDENSLLLCTGGHHTTGGMAPLTDVTESFDTDDSPMQSFGGYMTGTGGSDTIGFSNASSAAWHIWAMEVSTGPPGDRIDVQATEKAANDGASITVAITTGVDANYIVAAAMPRTGTSRTITGITHDGDAMDLLVSIANEVYLFGLAIPGSGSSVDVIATPNSSGKTLLQVASLSNVLSNVSTGSDNTQSTAITLTPGVAGGLVWCAGQDDLAGNPIIGRGGLGYFPNESAGIALGESSYVRAMSASAITARWQTSMNNAVAAAFDVLFLGGAKRATMFF